MEGGGGASFNLFFEIRSKKKERIRRATTFSIQGAAYTSSAKKGHPRR